MSQCVSVCTCSGVGGGGANRPHPVTSSVSLSAQVLGRVYR